MSAIPPNPYQQSQPLSPGDEKLWATLIHLGGIFFFFLPALVGYFVLRDRGPFIREHTRTALNFQLTVLLGYLIGFATLGIFIGGVIVFAAGLLNIVFSIIATVAANRGNLYTYPVAIKFVSD
ncbi:DUF4870 domain-containing protein [Frigoribacterium sp. CG_9.8]|jgi:uncharacterized Tic20 family protein|uniref:DUF4870 domain-containing protein n=1 Tax=Frigoribacterium sp. CG_9.8 TaxID=2787733 RepID=UPI0018CA488D|nr:DUF4870 domain-containing protein [Frigoribacterium sp. CG_9.8]MBG6107338.1 putative Tic20 family protein [Frigoribacterium sp. CG_9.8]